MPHQVSIRYFFIYVVLTLCPIANSADDARLGIGIGILYGEADFIFSFRPETSHWVYGFRHGYNESENEGLGFSTKEEETFTGPIVYYLLQPESNGSFYGSAGLFNWSLTHSAPEVNESAEASTTLLFLGGGYTKWFNDRFYFDVGISFSTGGKLYAETSVSSIETTGLEGRLILGIALGE